MRDIPCEIEHVRMIRVQGVQELQVGDFAPCKDLLATHARTLEHGGIVLACFGVFPMWPGVGQAWSVLSEEVLKDHPLSLSRYVSRWLDIVESREGFRRIQAAVADGHESGHTWIQWLGFEWGCRMQNYGLGGDGDFHLYARVH